MTSIVPGSPYLHRAPSVTGIMARVLVALLPSIAIAIWMLGLGVLSNLLWATLFCLLAEALVLILRHRSLQLTLMDGSAVVTAWLLALSLPPGLPWWGLLVGSLMAIIVAKHMYGGLGQNPFNPAMVGFCVLIVAYPTAMTQWAVVGQPLWSGVTMDTLAGATPLDGLRTATHLGGTSLAEALQRFPQWSPWAASTWINIAYLLGGLWLIQQKIISWRMPLAFLLTLALGATLLWAIGDHPTPWFHLCNGATMLGAFFIVTDPVTGATTPKGQIIFAVGIAVFTLLIRAFGNYPDGLAFAVLLMNLCVPLLDAKTQPKIFGHDQ